MSVSHRIHNTLKRLERQVDQYESWDLVRNQLLEEQIHSKMRRIYLHNRNHNGVGAGVGVAIKPTRRMEDIHRIKLSLSNLRDSMADIEIPMGC